MNRSRVDVSARPLYIQGDLAIISSHDSPMNGMDSLLYTMINVPQLPWHGASFIPNCSTPFDQGTRSCLIHISHSLRSFVKTLGVKKL